MYANPLSEETEPLHAMPRSSARPGSRTAVIRMIQERRGEDPCFRTDQRLLCRRDDCEWRSECRRLVAAWKR